MSCDDYVWSEYEDGEDRLIDEEVESEPYFPTPDEEDET